jgi:phosphoribosyl-ATP pyrophosphohydrolase
MTITGSTITSSYTFNVVERKPDEKPNVKKFTEEETKKLVDAAKKKEKKTYEEEKKLLMTKMDQITEKNAEISTLVEKQKKRIKELEQFPGQVN